MLYAIKNLSVYEATPFDPATTVVPPVPEEAMKSKEDFIKWVQNPKTEYCHFSAVEPVDVNARIGSNNPPYKLHAIVADYDATISDEQIDKVARSENPPNWVAYTFQNGLRCVWLFEQPAHLPSKEFHQALLKLMARKLSLARKLPGFDETAYYNPSVYYAYGRDWKQLSTVPISGNQLCQWSMEAGERCKWRTDDLLIPIDVVAQEVQARWPGRWEGAFELKARGIRFWDDTADNTTAAIVRENGMQCFTGPKGFVPWREIFGNSFVEKFQADTIGAAIADHWFDGNNVWYLGDDGNWTSIDKTDFRLRLKVKYRLNTVGTKTTPSDAERATFAVQEQKQIVAAVPVIHREPGFLVQDGVRMLNTTNIRCVQPSETGGTDWGDGFPWLAQFLSEFFDPAEQLAYLLAWWKHFYVGGLTYAPTSGQAVFITGNTEVGKTLLSTGIISQSVGGFADASAFLLGEDRFNSHILSKPVMAVDDTAPATDAKKFLRYSASIKKIVANAYHVCEAKFKNAGLVKWQGRIVVTCNLDPESIRVLPNLDISILDKVHLFQAARTYRKFPDRKTLDAIIKAELPYLCRYLVNWEVPVDVVGTSRFGVSCYHCSDMVRAALESSPAYSFYELLREFLVTYSQSVGPGEKITAWEGTATKLLSDMMMHPTIGQLAKSSLKTASVATYLGQLKSRGVGISNVRTHTERIWSIPFALLRGKMTEVES